MIRLFRWVLKKDSYESEVASLKTEIKEAMEQTNIEIVKANYALKKSVSGDILKATGGFKCVK